MEVDHYLTRREVEARLSLHRNTVGRLLARGAFPNAFKTPGGRWRIPASDLWAFVQSRRSAGAGGGGR